MKNSRPILYTKIGCPWCAQAREVLDREGVAYDELSVTSDAAAFAEMLLLSGQAKAPVLDWSGNILADFGAAELGPFLAARVRPLKVKSRRVALRPVAGSGHAADRSTTVQSKLAMALRYLRASGANAIPSRFAARLRILPVIFASLLVGGCANLSNHSSGFLDSYDHLKADPKDSHRLVYERTDWRKSDYTSVLIEPAVVRLTAEDQKKISAKEITDLAAYGDKALRKAFAKEWMIVTAAEAGTLRIRSAITGVDTSNPALNVVTSLVICPVDNGGVSVEYEVRDASNGEQLVALAGFTNATPLQGLWAYTRFGQAHYAIDHWSIELRKIVHPTVTKIAAK